MTPPKSPCITQSRTFRVLLPYTLHSLSYPALYLFRFLSDGFNRYTPHKALAVLALVLYALLLILHLYRLYAHRVYAFSILLVTTCVFEVVGMYSPIMPAGFSTSSVHLYITQHRDTKIQ